MSEAIELLTEDDQGRAVEGPKIPVSGVARYLDESDPDALEDARLAYEHKFFRRDRMGRPMPEPLVHYLVPDYLLCEGRPTGHALRLVAEREGWTDA